MCDLKQIHQGTDTNLVEENDAGLFLHVLLEQLTSKVASHSENMAFVPSCATSLFSRTSRRQHVQSKTRKSGQWKSLSTRYSSFLYRPHSSSSSPVFALNTREDPDSEPVRLTVMALDKVVVAGGTGFVGSRLVRSLVADGVAVTVLTRSISSGSHLPRDVTLQKWAPDSDADETKLGDVMRDADLVVNLCGQPVVSRWSESGKAGILSSRIKPTSLIARVVAGLPESERPTCVVSTSAVGLYGSWPATCPELDESSTAGAASDFLVNTCKRWEAAAAPLSGVTRHVTLRFGVVLAPGGGALANMLPVFQLGAGGPVGSGLQYVSWIHADDIVQMIKTAANQPDVSGVYNATAPNPVTMAEMSSALARALRRPCFFPVPGLVLRTVFGEGAQVVLEGQRVLPKRWLAQGYDFSFSSIDGAMAAVAKEIKG